MTWWFERCVLIRSDMTFSSLVFPHVQGADSGFGGWMSQDMQKLMTKAGGTRPRRRGRGAKQVGGSGERFPEVGWNVQCHSRVFVWWSPFR